VRVAYLHPLTERVRGHPAKTRGKPARKENTASLYSLKESNILANIDVDMRHVARYGTG